MTNKFEKALDDAAKASITFATVLKPIESDTHDLLVKAATDAVKPYARASNQVESHLTRAQQSLEKCTELRKQAHELESEAIKLVWNTVVISARTDADKLFDEEYYTHRQFTASEQYPQDIAPKPVDNKPARTPATTFANVRMAQQNKREIALAYEEALTNRQKVQGSSFNFTDRHAAIRRLFTFLLVDSYFRCRAAAEGLVRYYQITADLPAITDSETGFADRLLDWVNNQLQALENKVDSEIECETTVWLRAGALGLTWGANNLLTSTSGVFNVAETLFQGLKCLRLRGLAFGAYLNAEQSQPSSFMLSVRPPGLDSAFPIALPVVNTKYQAVSDPQFKSNALFNLSPVGEWSLNFLNEGKSNTGEVATKLISDIAIRMHIAGLDTAT